MDPQQRKRMLEAARAQAKTTAKLLSKYDGLTSLGGMQGAIYTRVSTRYQEDNGSLKDQLKRCKEFAELYGVAVRPELIEEEVFDGESLARPKLQNLERAARDGLFNVLIADKTDRFSRGDLYTTGWFKHQLHRYGVKVICLDAPDDSDQGLMLQTIMQAYAHQEKKRITQRTQDGLKRRVRGDGRYGSPALRVGRTPKYGYMYAEGESEKGKRYRYVVDEDAAQWVRWIFQEYANGVGRERICAKLIAMNVPPPNDYLASKGYKSNMKSTGRWAVSTLNTMLSDQAYIGRHRAYKTKLLKEEIEDNGYRVLVKWRERRNDDDPEVVIYDETVCPAIIASDVWDKVAERRRRNALEAHRRATVDRPYLLRVGLILCGHCKRGLAVRHSFLKSGIRTRYACRTTSNYNHGRINTPCPHNGFVAVYQEPIDEAVWKHVIIILSNPDTVQQSYNELVERDTPSAELHADRIASLNDMIEAAERKLKRLTRLAGDAEDETLSAAYAHEAKEVSKEIKGHTAERARLEEQHAKRAGRADIFASLVAKGNEVVIHLMEMPIEQRRDLMFEAGMKVYIYGKNHPYGWEIEANVAMLARKFRELPGIQHNQNSGCSERDSV